MIAEALHTQPLLVPGARGSGKTAWLIGHARELLAAGVPARRMLVVTFSPRNAARIAAHLPAEADAETPRGVSVRTAHRLCASLLRECYSASGRATAPRILSAFERATILHAAATRAAAALGAAHPLRPMLNSAGGLAEIELLLHAVAGQGGSPGDLAGMVATLPAAASPLDRAVLDGIVEVYRLYRDLCAGVGGLAYQEVAARVASMLADPALTAPIAARIDYLLIDDLERAEPAQVEVLARIASSARLVVTFDPAGLCGDRALRVAALARERLGLDLTPQLPLPRDGFSMGRGERLCCSPLPIKDVSEGLALRTSPAREKRTPTSQSPLSLAGAEEHALIVAEELLDTSEATYVARAARAACAGAADPQPDAEPDVLILAPAATLVEPLLAALRAEGLEAVDATGRDGAYDPAVRYALAWLHALAQGTDEHWERILASPHACLPVADVARLRRWATDKSRPLEAALLAAANGACESVTDAARTRLAALARLLDELRRSTREGEAPGVTLHRLLAREDLMGALLVGPTDAGATPPDPRGLAGLCDLVARLQELWQQVYGRQPSLGALLDRLREGLAHLLERADTLAAGRVVLADLEAAADWRARVVIVPGLGETFLPRPLPRSPLLSGVALDHLRGRWALPWPAGFAVYAQGERRALDLAMQAAREQVMLTRALRYDGEEATVPSPLLLDVLGAAEVNAQTCAAVGARFDRWSVTHEAAPEADAPLKRAADLLALPAGEAARDLDTLLYRHLRQRAERDREDADQFIAEARAILAAANAPARARYLAVEDPFARLPAASCALPAGAAVAAREVNEYLYCPRRFYYSSLVGMRSPDDPRLSYGLLLGRAAQALHRLYPTPGTATVDDATEVLRLLWEGETLPGLPEPDDGAAEQFAGRFGPRLAAEATRALAHGVLRRLAAASRHPQLGRQTRATGLRVELPVELPGGRKVRVTATVDRVTEKLFDDGRAALGLVDYRSGASDPTPAELVKGFLNREGDPDWRPQDYTLPVMFLGLAGNRKTYEEHSLPRLAVRELAVATLGKNKNGYPSYSRVAILAQGAPDDESVTLAELCDLRETIAQTVAQAAQGPHAAAPADSFRLCKGCLHRFCCDGPDVEAPE